jgi:hypothetical protein
MRAVSLAFLTGDAYLAGRVLQAMDGDVSGLHLRLYESFGTLLALAGVAQGMM